ncbi:auxin-responsive protein SAUR62-like [Gossypium australe]|uniref:Auxin-responsive protein SAUR62-like n=1 Tax=Gossypium australe TaxID=47621 RepID=A0A5B6WKK2_9ROSI|nr:auxin-responsive protein SAUR62-like [Gossypium australe]
MQPPIPLSSTLHASAIKKHVQKTKNKSKTTRLAENARKKIRKEEKQKDRSSSFLLTLEQSTMVSAKKLIKLARKWQKMAAIRRKRITSPSATSDTDANSCSTSTAVEHGHFVVYSVDQKRFVLPLEYLKNEIVMELFNLAEEEFGLSVNKALILPCDATFMEYVIALIKRKTSKDVEKALILSVASGRCSSSYFYQQETSLQLPLWSI